MVRPGMTVLLLAAGVVQPACAAAITYTIALTSDAGGNAGSGSFVYDASQPLDSRFSSFTVTWFNYSFDLTISANNGGIRTTGCGTAKSAATVFMFLTGTGVCSPTDIFYWSANNNPNISLASFSFTDTNNDSNNLQSTGISSSTTGRAYAYSDFGSFTVTQAPEPSTFVLLAACVSAIIGKRRLSTRSGGGIASGRPGPDRL